MNLLPTVTAVQFRKQMKTGRTAPCEVVCEDEGGKEIELVVKFRGHGQLTPGGLSAEAMASFVAQDLDLPVMPAYAVEVEAPFAATIQTPAIRQVVENSIGLNFGSEKWGPGYTVWTRERPLDLETIPTAMEIFAFDGIIQNPDRKVSNPNCSYLGQEFLIYDHELAFSHLGDILGTKPWEQSGMSCLQEHAMRSELKGRRLDLPRLKGALDAIDAERVSAYIEAVPDAWNGQMVNAEAIGTYLLDTRENFPQMQARMENLL